MMNRTSVSRSGRDKNILTLGERFGEIVAIAIILLFATYFVYLEQSSTGFMTSRFGTVEAILFYGSFAVAIMASASRSVLGRRDRARPFEFVSNVFTAIAAVWLLEVFPFNFAHIADPLPSALEILFSWNPNTFGWVVMLLIALGSIGTAIYNAIRLIIR